MLKRLVSWFNRVDYGYVSIPYHFTKVNDLSVYNSEVSRGILHSSEYSQKMAELQMQYNLGLKRHYEVQGYIVI